MRNLDEEFTSNVFRDYQYGFDLLVRRALLNRWASSLSPNEPALEMGSFDGSMTELILDFVQHLEVVEGSGALADQVGQRFGQSVTVHHSLFEDFSPQKLFGNIFLVHALEHVENPKGVLRRAADWLTNEGRLFIAVPNANALSRQIAVEMGVVPSAQSVTEGEALHGHLRTYNLDTLRRVVLDAELSIYESGGVVLKTLSNSQFDQAVEAGIVSGEYIDACERLSRKWPDFSSSIFIIAGKSTITG